MFETLLRWSLAAILVAFSSVLILASAWMNYLAWRGQGGDADSAWLLGYVSITFDGFKSTLPVIVGSAWRAKHCNAAVIAAVFFCGCLAFSLFGALGFADATRVKAAGIHEAGQLRHVAAKGELLDIETQLAALGKARPQQVVEQIIEQSKQDRRWIGSGMCVSPVNEAMRSHCKAIAVLRTELASSIAAGELRTRARGLQNEINGLLAGGVRAKLDAQAEFIAGLVGVSAERVQTSRSLLVPLLLEFGAAFGLLIAGLPLSTRAGHKMKHSNPPPPIALEAKPTRFIRENGRLLIGRT